MAFCVCRYNDIISLDNLLEAWQEFIRSKRSRKDIQEFEHNLMHNIIFLHDDLADKTYEHSEYEAFNISDPKPRNIHKAQVRDRLLHHAIYRILYPYFDRQFSSSSYSCRLGKGTHRALNQFRKYSYKASWNHSKTLWILKCDIRKFFASIDQGVLMEILQKHIEDKDIIWLLGRILSSFESTVLGKGLPLGNLTSQLLVNIYMNEFDQFVKHKIKAKYYIRYADDFVTMSTDKVWLEDVLPRFHDFLTSKLKLSLHPDKVFIKTLASGVDFLGWVHFTDHRVLRSAARRRMFNNLKNNETEAMMQSYTGLLSHGNSRKLIKKLKEII
jgi:retron-type reverse transcriptase